MSFYCLSLSLDLLWIVTYCQTLTEGLYQRFVSDLPKLLTKLGLRFLKTVSRTSTHYRPFKRLSLRSGVEKLCSIAAQILEQKALCQQDPDQDEDEEAPEDQAEYDSVLISSAGDLVAALANALGADFAQIFNTFFPLISKYYVRTARYAFCSVSHAYFQTEKESFPRRSLSCYRMSGRDHCWHEERSYSFDRTSP
jgi:hypothetical protein